MQNNSSSPRSFALAFFFLCCLHFFPNAQTLEKQCRETMKALEEIKREVETKQRDVLLKENQLGLKTELGTLRKAVSGKTLVSQERLATLARFVNLEITKEVGQLTIEERHAYQKQILASFDKEIKKIAGIELKVLRAELSKAEAEKKTRMQGAEITNCREILRISELAAVPDVIKECEEGCCGTWTKDGDKFKAEWVNGAKAILTIEKFNADEVIITRNDTGDSFSKNFSARYTGKLSGNKVVDGKVTWTQNGRSWSGKWSADW